MAQESVQMSSFDMPARYARALFQLAQDDDNIAIIAQNIDKARQLFRDHPTLAHILSDRGIDRDDLFRAVKAILVDMDFHPMVQNFIGLIIRKGRSAHIDQIFDHFETILRHYNNITHIDIQMAGEASQSQKDQLRTLCVSHFGERAEISFHIDETLLGGMALCLPDKIFDASLKGRLTHLEDVLARHFQNA